jgi:hypothetical protein
MGVLVSNEGRISCIFTGLPAVNRKSGTRDVHDTIIVEAFDNRLTDVQRKLLCIYLSSHFSLAALTDLVTEENGAIVFRASDFMQTIENLYVTAASADERFVCLELDHGVWLDGENPRRMLWKSLSQYDGNPSAGEILALVTTSKHVSMLTQKSTWALTDHPSAVAINSSCTNAEAAESPEIEGTPEERSGDTDRWTWRDMVYVLRNLIMQLLGYRRDS